MGVPHNAAKPDCPLVILCPGCGKRLPMGGKLSMQGTTGIFCRNCHRTVQITMALAEDAVGGDDG